MNIKYLIEEYKQGIKTEINKTKREPVVYANNPSNLNNIDWENGSPILKSFSFHKLFSAKEIYIENRDIFRTFNR